MKDFLSIADYTSETLLELLDLAGRLKSEFKKGGNKPLLKDKVLAMVFQKPSLRTRVSFDVGMLQLGGTALYLSPTEIGLGKRESIADVARVLSGYVDIIMARVFAHDHVLELAKWADVPVINGLSDYNHPCQALADALTIQEEFGDFKGLTITYVGDGNNVAVSLMYITTLLGANFTIANPQGYGMPDEAVELAQGFSIKQGSSISILSDSVESVKRADVIYTDTWTSMGQEEETKIRQELFRPYQVNSDLLAKAKSHTIVLHCLPAHRGEEITDKVADGPNSRIFPQAENRMHAQKAILVRLLGAG